MMSQYLPLSSFKKIYIVDLCKSLCVQAGEKVKAKGWTNVTVVEADACTFEPPEGTASLVTFSYSLSSAFLLAASSNRCYKDDICRAVKGLEKTTVNQGKNLEFV